MIPLDEEPDRTISELFAEPYGESRPDDVFVASVMGQIAQRRRRRTAIGAGVAAALLGGAALLAMPTVMASTDVVASLPLSLIGFAASLPIGIVLLALSRLRLTDLN